MYLMKNVIRKTVASATVFNILIYYISQGIRLILVYKCFFIFHRITDQFFCIQIFPVHVHCRNLMILVSGVIINSPGSIHAGGINRDFIFSVRHLTAPSLLFYRSQNMEELSDTVLLSLSRYCMHSCIRHTYKPGHR